MQRENLDSRALHRSQAGFTLIELMMVVLIIAIMITFLVPTFFGASRRANDRAMQSSLRNGLTTAKAMTADNLDYTAATPAALNAEGLPVRFVAGGVAPSGQNEVSVDAVSGTYIVFGGLSKSGSCFFLSDDILIGTRYATAPGGGGCAASGAPVPGDAAWKSRW
jgi:prepilin-type N-terminal cleavage/methylation domain-containing protein